MLPNHPCSQLCNITIFFFAGSSTRYRCAQFPLLGEGGPGHSPQLLHFTASLLKNQASSPAGFAASRRQTFTPARATAKTNQKMTITRG